MYSNDKVKKVELRYKAELIVSLPGAGTGLETQSHTLESHYKFFRSPFI